MFKMCLGKYLQRKRAEGYGLIQANRIRGDRHHNGGGLREPVSVLFFSMHLCLLLYKYRI